MDLEMEMENFLADTKNEQSYCICGQPYEVNKFMIQCDICKDWYHGSCINIQEHIAIEIDKYHCPRCAPIYGPSQYKAFQNVHRHDFWDENASDKPVQTGTTLFIRELRSRHFSNENEIIQYMKGSQLTEALLVQNGFDCPIIIDNKDGLSMKMPPEDFTLYDVESYVGSDFEMDVIDVTRQTDIRMKLTDFVSYFNSLNRTRCFNVVSLEFTGTALAELVEAPLIARKMDWANNVWPNLMKKPQVQKYCLMSVQDSYTDFHIDFGGTSVWYHVLRGEKIFYFVRPTTANLTLYQQWMTSSNQSETFFGDQVDQCYKCTLHQGQTMFIPTGWIHAVFTPVDSLVFGGNFLHNLNIPMQLQVYDIEKKIKTTSKFLYPYFELINWFAAQDLLVHIRRLNAQEQKCPQYIIKGLKSLLTNLKQWNTEKNYNILSREQIPININVVKLFKDISKEIRQAERFINTLNPPKPERESKRKRKKPVNNDFFDYSLSKSSLEFMTADHIPRALGPNSPLKLTLPKPNTYPYDKQAHIQPADVISSFDEWGSQLEDEETTTVNKGGVVLKIKIGTKDIIPVVDHSDLSKDVILPHIAKSIYDFHDDSEREDDDFFNLSIDENPKTNKNQCEERLKFISPLPVKTKKRLELEAELPKNGIESLLKASALTNKFLSGKRPVEGRTSPSTQEAIAGMLSISQTYIEPKKNTKLRKHHLPIKDEDDDDDINNAHQDDDYIYPALDNSDDDDVHIFKPRGRSKVDEPWNPKARVGPLLPKMNRPAREGTKKMAVEKVLEAAAKRSMGDSTEKNLKRQYRRKKIKTKIDEKTIETPGTSSSSNTSNSPSAPQTSRPRKGMKTVKQRLGKILKIHKMIH